MQGPESDSSEALLAWIRAEMATIRPDVLEAVFERWILRVAKCIEHEDPYFPED
jgi:hypothetical protein